MRGLFLFMLFDERILTAMRYQQKAYGCILRGKDVLVFRELKEGAEEDAQFPGGTIEDGEPIEAGLLREVEEETGLSDLRIVRQLGCATYFATPNHTSLRHFYLLECNEAMPDTWIHYEEHSCEFDYPLPYQFSWMPLEEACKGLAGEHHMLLHLV